MKTKGDVTGSQKGNTTGRQRMKSAGGILGVTLVVVLVGSSAWGQAPDSGGAEKVRQEVPVPRVDVRPYQTFYLTNVTQTNEANEVTVAVRNLLPPDIKLYLIPNQNAISMRGSTEEIALVQKIINDLDRPKKTYRLTYAVTEMDGTKRIGTQHFAMVVVSGQRTVMKQGSKVPVATGSFSTNGKPEGAQTQFTYVDVGTNFDATLDESANGVRLRTKVEQLGIREEQSGVGAADPVIRQTSLEGTSFLTAGKPLVLGSLDVPGSTRHLDVEVVMEAVR
jgi:type II secretory pathway component GspD/PulD (secretin)